MNKIVVLILVSSISFSQWSADPDTPLEVSSWGVVSNGCSDGTGGAFVQWTNGGEDSQIYLRRIDRFGNILWNNYIHVGGEGDKQSVFTSIIEDGFGGTIVGITDLFEIQYWFPFWEYDIKTIVQRIDESGNKLWGENGLRLLDTDMDYQLIDIISDDNGGVIVLMVLFELPEGQIQTNILSVTVQRIDADGNRLWGDFGIILVPDMGPPLPVIKNDGDGGAYVSYSMNNSDFVYVHLDSDGNILWEIPYTSAYWVNVMENAGTDGLFLAGIHTFSTITNQLKLNYITETGEFPWTEDGIIPYIIESEVPQHPWITNNLDNSLTVGLLEINDGNDGGILQRFSISGEPMWISPTQISTYPSESYFKGIISTQDSCNIILLLDDRNYPGDPYNYQIFTQIGRAHV